MRTPDNATVPVLVLANKQDLPGARTPEEVSQLLQLPQLRQLWELEAACAVTGEGLDAAMAKLHGLIAKKKKLAKRARNKTR